MADENNTPKEGEDGADVTDEWEKMLAGGDGSDQNGSEETGRVLNQDEIDLLLGFDHNDADGESTSGIQALLGRSSMAYEKLPMLEVVYDRMVRVLSSSLRNFTSENVEISVESMTSLKFEDYLNSIPLPALLVVFRAVEWENFGLATVDSSLIYSMVDVLLGGRRSNRPIRVEGRPYTTIEQDIVKRLVDIILHDMGTAFDPLSPVTFQHERLENNPRFATITRPNNAALLVKLRIEMEDRGGMVEILIPHATLEPIRDLLTQIFMGEQYGHDTAWEQHFSDEIKSSNVDISVVLEERQITMGEILSLKIGSTLLLDADPHADVNIRCGDVAIMRGKIGRIGDKMAVSINEPIKAKREEYS